MRNNLKKYIKYMGNCLEMSNTFTILALLMRLSTLKHKRMKNLKLVVKEHDMLEMYEKVVKDIFIKKKVKINYKDDDAMADYLMGLHTMGFPNFEFREITQMLMYNSMLQADAFSPSKIVFKCVREEYEK